MYRSSDYHPLLAPSVQTTEEKISADIRDLTGGYMYGSTVYGGGLSKDPAGRVRDTVTEYTKARVRASVCGYSRLFLWLQYILERVFGGSSVVKNPHTAALTGCIIHATEKYWKQETAERDILAMLMKE